ncbi:MAG: tetratricopeptide repeat protein [Pedobacter sp.]|uniref:tetratricopeptide repeat protein n=1 Tax=Bacteroidota TaxID=976 RepID=UPI002806E354|nr:tetratricopeptide repeat protein [Pedobacter sp.]MDQ8005490.1 tetratricopeptide repeat protein [Pedobacter sp.]
MTSKQLTVLSFVLILLCTSIPKVKACLNGEHFELTNGTILYVDRDYEVPEGHSFPERKRLLETLDELDSLYNATRNISFLSDKGLVLILLERYQQAIGLYLKIERMQPNRYSTASNLGTVYELTGQNIKALEWIKKSIEIDPKSHHQSEWIHVKILEAKIRGDEKHTTQSLLGLDFGNGKLPISKMSKKELETLRYSLYYQLNERMSFIKPQDKIVAQLLFDLGNVSMLLRWDKVASEVYKQARRYGFLHPDLDFRIKESRRLYVKEVRAFNKANAIKEESNRLLYYGLAMLGLVAIGGGFVYLRRVKIRSIR